MLIKKKKIDGSIKKIFLQLTWCENEKTRVNIIESLYFIEFILSPTTLKKTKVQSL